MDKPLTKAASNAVAIFDQLYNAATRRFDHAGLLAEMTARNGGKRLPVKLQRTLARMVSVYLASKVQS